VSLIDLHGFVANLKDHVSEHGFHVHGDRHFVETYSNRQTWEVDLHPDDACGGPLDMVLCIEAESRTLLTFEDDVNSRPEDEDPDDAITVPSASSSSTGPRPGWARCSTGPGSGTGRPPQRLQRIVGVEAHVQFAAHRPQHRAVAVDHERLALVGQGTPPDHAETLSDAAARVRQQREAQGVGVIELALPIHLIGADSHDAGSEFAELR